MDAPRYPGVDTTIGVTVYTVPPLAMKSVRALRGKLALIETDATGMPTEESEEIVYDLIHTALQRNYPALTRAELVDALDILSFPMALDATLAASGLLKVPAGNGLRAPASPPTGTPSTPAAAPSSDGPGSTSTSA